MCVCACVCDLETSAMRLARPEWGSCATEEEIMRGSEESLLNFFFTYVGFANLSNSAVISHILEKRVRDFMPKTD